MSPTDGMYGARAELYDALYHWKDYQAEAERLVAVLGSLGVRAGSRLLELGCGSGGHLVHLRDRFDCMGLDLNEGMLERARARLPGVPLVCGDMASFTVERPVHAVVSLFSALGYVHPDRLPSLARCVRDALLPGGVALIEPWLTPDRIRAGRPSLETLDEPERKVVRACTSRQDGRATHLEFHWLLATAAGVEHWTDPHVLWCSTADELCAIGREAGLEARFDEIGLDTGRGLWVLRRPG